MMRIDQMHYHHEDAVTLLNSDVIDITIKVVDITIKVVVKGWTCILRLLISLIHVHMRGFILILFYHRGEYS
jgi:hypothetical protein